MHDDIDISEKKYYLTENHDSYIDLVNGKCEYIDDLGNKITEGYGIDNYWYIFLSYLIENNGRKIHFKNLYRHIYGYDPYDLISTDAKDDDDDPIKRCLKQLNDFYRKILSPKERDKAKFYKHVKNKGFKLFKDGNYYSVELPKQYNEIENDDTNFSIEERYKSIVPLSGNNYCNRKNIEKQIEILFRNNHFVFLSGLSGTGKSEVARAYGMNSNYSLILPLKLQEDGSGSIEYLIKQLNCSSIKSIHDSIKDKKVLIILDNYNSESEIIFEIREIFSKCDILVTSQISTESMQLFGAVIQMGDGCNQDEEWVEEIFIKYGGLGTLSEAERKSIHKIANILGYHTMLLCQIALQLKRSGDSLDDILLNIQAGIGNYLRKESDIKTSMIKDGRFLSRIAPYELLKILFSEKIMSRKFSDIERQVLGTIVYTENYINNIDFICELVGDNKKLGCNKARNAIFNLQEDHIVEISQDMVSLHPLIRTLVMDEELDDTHNTIADISYDFLLHILKNKLVEKVTLTNELLVNYVWERKHPTYFSWVMDFVHSEIIPRLKADKILPYSIGIDESYFIVAANNEIGGEAIYISYNDEVICIIDASRQTQKEYRYYNGKKNYTETTVKCAQDNGVIIECFNKGETLVLPGEIKGIKIISIGRYVFCSKKIPQTVIVSEGVEEIRDYSFLNAEGMQAITLPDSLNYIGLRAFEFCKDLKKINWGKGLKHLKMSSFANCVNLVGELELPDGMTELQRYSFMNTSIEKLTLPKSLNDIGRGCFYDCTKLKKIDIGGLSEIRYQMFFGCDNLEKVVIPGEVKTIHEEAFGRCVSLKEVIVEEGVERINNCAFIHCTSLVDVWLPISIFSIAKGVFAECPNVVAHVYEGSSAAKQLERYCIELGKTIHIEYR